MSRYLNIPHESPKIDFLNNTKKKLFKCIGYLVALFLTYNFFNAKDIFGVNGIYNRIHHKENKLKLKY